MPERHVPLEIPGRVEINESDALRMLVDHLPIGAGLFTIDGRLLVHNREFGRIYSMDGLPSPDLSPAGSNPTELTIWELIEAGFFDAVFDNPHQVFSRTFQSLARGEDYVKVLEVLGRQIEIYDRPIGNGLVLSTHTDVSERILAQQQVEYMAWHDPLTGLPNRAAFTKQLEKALEEAELLGKSFGILSVDLDRFKDVNDVFGHGTGDALLKQVAARFERLSNECWVARLGGDEFVFLCTKGSHPQHVGQLAETLFHEFEGEFETNGSRLLVNLSAGAAVYPEDGTTPEDLLNAADAALYRAKEEGRGTYRFFEPEMDRRIRNRRRLAQDLRLALSRRELTIHYQPQSTVTGKLTGFEALLRWEHPKHGFISPAEFIPIAEESGLIVDIGAWVLKMACGEATTWGGNYSVSVNLSPLQFRHGELATLVNETLVETGLRPERLELEITEGVLVHDFPRALETLRRIKALGVHVAMDDFGTGYSSLSYLQAFPFDKLKIDRSFIGKLDHDQHAREIVRAVIGLGRGLKMPVVAEGVETTAQLEFLATEQCFGIQGYILGRPQLHADINAKIGAFNGN